VLCLILGHHGHCVLSGAMFATGWPTGSRSHVASHSRSEAGRWRCLWNISSQLTCPTLGMVSVLGSSEAWDWRILRSREMGGTEAIVFGIRFSIFLHAERPLRRGSIARRILRRWEMDWVMSLWVVHVCRMWFETWTQKGVCVA